MIYSQIQASPELQFIALTTNKFCLVGTNDVCLKDKPEQNQKGTIIAREDKNQGLPYNWIVYKYNTSSILTISR